MALIGGGRPRLVAAVVAVTTVGAALAIGPGLGISSAQAPPPGCAPQGIDTFDDPMPEVPLVADEDDTSVSRVDGPLPGIAVGGEREMTLTRTAPDPPLGGSAQLGAGGGDMNWSNNVNVVSNGSLTWDGPDGDATTTDPEGLGGVDYSGAGDAGTFSFEVAAWDIPVEAPFTLEIYSNAGAASTQTVNPTPVPVPAGTLVEFPISGFTPIIGGGADFSNVGAIVLRFAASDHSLDMEFDDVTGPCAAAAAQPPATTTPPTSPAPPPAPAVSARPTFTG